MLAIQFYINIIFRKFLKVLFKENDSSYKDILSDIILLHYNNKLFLFFQHIVIKFTFYSYKKNNLNTKKASVYFSRH